MNGGDKLNGTQRARFRRLQKAFRTHQLWVGWADSDPDTADQLTVQDDHPDWNDEIDDADDLLSYVLDGDGAPADLAEEYVGILRPLVA